MAGGTDSELRMVANILSIVLISFVKFSPTSKFQLSPIAAVTSKEVAFCSFEHAAKTSEVKSGLWIKSWMVESRRLSSMT